MNMRSVLVIENDGVQVEMLRQELLKHGLAVFAAGTCEEAEKLFEEHQPTIHIITFDGAVVDGTTPYLVTAFKKKGFEGAMIAASESRDLQRQLIENGCRYVVPDKNQIGKVVEGILSDLDINRSISRNLVHS